MTIAVRRAKGTEPAPVADELWIREKGLPHATRSHDAPDLKDRILVATDLGPVSRDVEEHAMELAAAQGASLVVVAVVQPDADISRLDDIARKAVERGIRTETRVASGDPVEAVLDVASSVGATGIVVADVQWHGEMPHACVCAPLIRRAGCPVLVLHPSAGRGRELPA